MSVIRIYYQHDGEPVPISGVSIHPGFLELLADLGIVEIRDQHIEHQALKRAYKIMRLREMLGVNLNGAAVIVDLLERISILEDEIEHLKK